MSCSLEAPQAVDGTINVSYNVSLKAIGISLCAFNRISQTSRTSLSLSPSTNTVLDRTRTFYPASVDAALTRLRRQQQCSPPTFSSSKTLLLRYT